MNWTELLSAKRMRKLLGGADSAKSAKEMRTEYERDYGRTIYSAPFRRLKQKAQVFPLEPGDYVRTRLTHSQEVSSVAEDIASVRPLGPDKIFYSAPEYPRDAWYEALVNACVHRSYGLKNMNVFVKMFDDKLTIESPGGFPPLVTPENIYVTHHPRNPVLMHAMFYSRRVRAGSRLSIRRASSRPKNPRS